MTNRDIIITGLQAWEIEIGSNCKNIATEFAKNNRVLYVNPPLDRLTAFKNKALVKRYRQNYKEVTFRQVFPNLWVFNPPTIIESISRLPFNLLFDLLNYRNNRLFARDIRSAIKRLNFKDYLHFCDSDMFRSFYLAQMLKPKKFIYYTRDNLLAVKYWQTQGLRLEPRLMAKADLVMANSTYLAQLASKHNPKSYFVGQGCDLSTFNPLHINNIPDDIAKIPKPIIGYIGALKTLRLDLKVISYLAEQRPDWNIVLVGPEDENFRNSSLHQLRNVHFLGSKAEQQLPEYLKAFDVAINPQILNEVTIGNYPRKIDEYFAMGKPVVATYTEAMRYFLPYVSLATNQQEWVQAVEMELSQDSNDKAIEREVFAGSHTWTNNVQEIYKYIDQQ